MTSPMQTSFAGGEIGPQLEGRIDLDDYAQAVKRCENFVPTLQGPAVRCPGTRFVKEVKTSANRTWLVRFEFNTAQAYELEFGDQYVRFYADHGVVLSAGVPYEIVSPYTAANLVDASGNFMLAFVQSGDVVYITHRDGAYAPYKLARLGATNWTLTQVNFLGGPFEDVDPDNGTTVYASAATGSGITLTASSAIFVAGHVGGLFYLERRLTDNTLLWESGKAYVINDIRKSDGKYYKALNAANSGGIKPTHTIGSAYDGNSGVQWEFLNPGYGYVKITAVGGGGTTATADVVQRLPDEVVGVGNPTTRWAFGWWSTSSGFPTHVTFFRERLVLARTGDQRIWMSVVGDYENFADRDDGGVVTADSSISIELVGEQVNRIEWIISAGDLLVGTAGGEHSVRELTKNEPLGPGNITAVQISSYGSASVQPVRAGNSLLFVQRSGRKLRELSFSPEAQSIEGYASIDLTVLAPHMVPRGTRITQLAYQQEPHSVVWAVRSDGYLMGCRFNANRKATAWFRRPLRSGTDIVEAIDCIPHPDGDQDELWLIVRRTINGATKRYVEFMEVEWTSDDDAEDRFYVDSGLTYDGASATTISGLTHLEGATVDVLVNGAAHPQRTVSGGAITLERAATVVQVGLPAAAKLRLLRQNVPLQTGTSQGKTKRIHSISVRLLDTLGGKIGPSESTMDRIEFRSSGDDMNQPPPAFTGDKVDIPFPSGHDTDADVWYVNDQPLPATVVAVMPNLEIE